MMIGDRRNTRGRQYVRRNNKTIAEQLPEWEKKFGPQKYYENEQPSGLAMGLNGQVRVTPSLNYITQNIHCPQPKIDAPVSPKIPQLEPLYEGSHELVYVSHIVNPHQFYVIRASIRLEMENILWDFQTMEHTRLSLRRIVPGQTILAYVGLEWKRSRVISVNLTEEEPMVSVFCIDYGHNAYLPLDKLSLLPGTEEMNFAPLAIGVCLYNCYPITGSWTESDRLFSEKIVLEKRSVLHVRRITALNQRRVRVECDLTTFDYGVNLVHALVFHERALMLDSNLEYPKVTCARKIFQINKVKKFFETDDRELVYITHVLNPHNFHVIKDRHIPAYLQLMQDMNTAYNKVELFDGKVYSPEKGMVYAVNMKSARWNSEDTWVRCEVLELPKRGWVCVKLPDVGFTDLVRWDSLRILHVAFVKQNAFATECHLANQIPFRTNWCTGSREFLRQYLGCLMTIRLEPHTDRTSQIHPRYISRDSVPVTLYDTEDQNNVVCINDEMMKRQFAYTLEYTFYETAVDKDLENHRPPHVTELTAALNLKETENYFDPLMLDVNILTCKTPSRIYVGLVDQQNKYAVLFTKMQQYYDENNEEEPEDKWKTGDKCGVRCLQEGLWRRAKILELHNNSAKVAYIDYAYIETVPKSSLKELPCEFYNVADRAIRCHLYGIMPGDGKKWSITTNEYLTQLVKKATEGKVCMTIIGESINNSVPIRLWMQQTIYGDSLEPNILAWRSLNQKLLIKGLCIPNQQQITTEDDTKETLSCCTSYHDHDHIYYNFK